METIGHLRKMKTHYVPGSGEPVRYELPMGEERVPMQDLLGNDLELEFTGGIACIHCARKIKKSFQQGYCYPCLRSLARCDSCLVKPELCHFDQGTCREPAWGEANCLIPHTVYLANSSGLKVGITRGLNPLPRWIDQGATQGLAIRTVATRLESGEVEVRFKSFVADKTNWRRMLQGPAEPLDLEAERERLVADWQANNPDQELEGSPPKEASATEIVYPVLEYPTKIRSHNFDKTPAVRGRLMGIKGQYLILDSGVLNIRKFGGYEIRLRYS